MAKPAILAAEGTVARYRIDGEIESVPVVAWDEEGEALIYGERRLTRASEVEGFEQVRVPKPDLGERFVPAAPGWSAALVDEKTGKVVRTEPVAMWRVFYDEGISDDQPQLQPLANAMIKTPSDMTPAVDMLHTAGFDDLDLFVRLIPPAGEPGGSS